MPEKSPGSTQQGLFNAQGSNFTHSKFIAAYRVMLVRDQDLPFEAGALSNSREAQAEIARELGEFDECLGLLSHPFDERYGYAVAYIKKLAEEKVLVVRSITPVK